MAGEEGPDGGVVPVEDDSEALGLGQGPGNRVCIVVRPHVQYFAAGAAEFPNVPPVSGEVVHGLPAGSSSLGLAGQETEVVQAVSSNASCQEALCISDDALD